MLLLSAEFNCVMLLSFTYTLQLFVRFATEVFKQLFCFESRSLWFVIGFVMVQFESVAIAK